jgi:hypothetical protein
MRREAQEVGGKARCVKNFRHSKIASGQEGRDARVKTQTKCVGGRDQTENGMGLGFRV